MSDPQPILVPREIVNADTVILIRWKVADGARVEAGAELCEIDTSKAVEAIEAPCGGYVRQQAAEGDEVEVGGVLGYLTEQADTRLPAPPEPESVTPVAPATMRISARARRAIDKLGLDEALFSGRGIVRERDVLEIAAEVGAAKPSHEDPRGPFHMEALGPVQRRVARVMEQSVAAIPAAYLERTIDIEPVRERARRAADEWGSVVTEVDLLVAAVAQACKDLPRFNCFVTRDDKLHVFDQVNVGVAVDVEGDLYVVVVRDAGAKAPKTIARELRGLQYMALRRRLNAEQLSGGTITVTSMIGRGIQRFQPIPYPQQAAIIGIADVEPDSSRTALTLVFDHRIANGTQAAEFLGAITESLYG